MGLYGVILEFAYYHLGPQVYVVPLSSLGTIEAHGSTRRSLNSPVPEFIDPLLGVKMIVSAKQAQNAPFKGTVQRDGSGRN
jgi:hypothetical protein